ncbi:hypothetical protein V1506DRAFT_545752 [Lipomyces tetrasporus]
MARMRQTVAKARRTNLELGAYGPMEYRNHRWLSWRRHSLKSGEPTGSALSERLSNVFLVTL